MTLRDLRSLGAGLVGAGLVAVAVGRPLGGAVAQVLGVAALLVSYNRNGDA